MDKFKLIESGQSMLAIEPDAIDKVVSRTTAMNAFITIMFMPTQHL
jgi:hypothetical protein